MFPAGQQAWQAGPSCVEKPRGQLERPVQWCHHLFFHVMPLLCPIPPPKNPGAGPRAALILEKWKLITMHSPQMSCQTNTQPHHTEEQPQVSFIYQVESPQTKVSQFLKPRGPLINMWSSLFTALSLIASNASQTNGRAKVLRTQVPSVSNRTLKPTCMGEDMAQH